MAKIDNAEVPSMIYVETAAASIATPAANRQRLFLDTDGVFKLKDESGTVSLLVSGIAPTLLDAKGDIIAATAADTPARLAVGANGTILTAASGETTGLKWVLPELSYVERTTNASITATVEASADTIVTAAAVTFDGSTVVMIEAYFPRVESDGSAAGRVLNIWLFDGATSLGLMGQIQTPAAAVNRVAFSGARRLTPSAAAHTYSIRGTVSAGTGVVSAGVGGAGAFVPGYIRIVTV